MKRLIKFSGLLLLGIALAPCLLSHRAAAATAKPPTGITVSPAFAQISIQATESEYPFKFMITNDQNYPVTLSLSSADFNSLNETGGLFFVGSNPTDLQKRYGLAKWMSLPASTATIPAKKTVSLTASILNQDTLAPGGHYGAIMLSIASDSNASTSQNKVAVQPIASLLLFVNKVGGDIHKLNLTNVYIGRSFFGLPSSITSRFHNDGNTHLVPRGTVTITNSKGRLVGNGVINENSNLILPQTYRSFIVPIAKISRVSVLARYKVDVNYRFDGYDQFRTYQTSILVVTPIGFIAVALIVVIMGAGAYGLYKRRAQLRAIQKEFQKRWQEMYARISFVRPMKKTRKKKIHVKIEDE